MSSDRALYRIFHSKLFKAVSAGRGLGPFARGFSKSGGNAPGVTNLPAEAQNNFATNHKKPPLKRAGFCFRQILVVGIRVGSAVVITLAAKGACCHCGDVALEVPSCVLFH